MLLLIVLVCCLIGFLTQLSFTRDYLTAFKLDASTVNQGSLLLNKLDGILFGISLVCTIFLVFGEAIESVKNFFAKFS